MLDTALEFCGASNDFWEQGDIENAIAALDEAYSLILKINTEKTPDLLQQREDLRFSISKRIIEIYASRGTVVNGHNTQIPLVMNTHVGRALSLFKDKDRKFFLMPTVDQVNTDPLSLKSSKMPACLLNFHGYLL